MGELEGDNGIGWVGRNNALWGTKARCCGLLIVEQDNSLCKACYCLNLVDEGDRGPLAISERLIPTYCLSLDLMV